MSFGFLRRTAPTQEAAPEMGKLEKIDFELVSRGARMLADNLYSNDYDTFRELIQNSAGAASKSIRVSLSNGSIDFADDGVGMSYRFVKEQWGKIGQRSTANQFGFFGFGRLSVFKIGDRVEIETETSIGEGKNERTKVYWNGLMDARMTTVPPIGRTGTTYRIALSEDKRIAEGALTDYLQKTIYLPLDITVNGKRVELVDPKAGSVCHWENQRNTFRTESSSRSAYEYDIALHPRMSGLVVLEKGLKITEFEFPLGGYINFHDNVKTASRGETVVAELDLRDKFKGAYYSWLAVQKDSLLETYTSKMLDIMEKTSYEDDYYVDRLGKLLVVGGRKIADWKSQDGVVYYFGNRDSKLVELGIEQGLRVLVTDEKRLARILRREGFVELEKVVRPITLLEHRGASTEQERRTLAYSANYLNDLAVALSEAAGVFSNVVHGAAVDMGESVKNSLRTFTRNVLGKEDEFAPDDWGHSAAIDDIAHVGEGVSGGGVTVFMGRYIINPEDHTRVVAWHVGGIGSGNIALNVDNPIIQGIVKSGRSSLLGPILDHEYAHEKCRVPNHGEAFSTMLSLIQIAKIMHDLNDANRADKK